MIRVSKMCLYLANRVNGSMYIVSCARHKSGCVENYWCHRASGYTNQIAQVK